MKKITIVLLLITILVSCRKANDDILDMNTTLSIEQAAKELGFTLKYPAETEKRVIKNYGSVEKWKEYILLKRTKPKHKHDNDKGVAHSSNTANNGQNANPNGFQIKVIDGMGFEYPTLTMNDNNLTILDFLDEQGFNFNCSDYCGASPTCAAKLRWGQVSQMDQTYLSDCEMDAGWVLPCVAYAESDITIKMEQEEEYITYSNSPFNNCERDEDPLDAPTYPGSGFMETGGLSSYPSLNAGGELERSHAHWWTIVQSDDWKLKSLESTYETSSPSAIDWQIQDTYHQDEDIQNSNFKYDIKVAQPFTVFGAISSSKKSCTYFILGNRVMMKSKKLNQNGQPALLAQWKEKGFWSSQATYNLAN